MPPTVQVPSSLTLCRVILGSRYSHSVVSHGEAVLPTYNTVGRSVLYFLCRIFCRKFRPLVSVSKGACHLTSFGTRRICAWVILSHLPSNAVADPRNMKFSTVQMQCRYSLWTRPHLLLPSNTLIPWCLTWDRTSPSAHRLTLVVRVWFCLCWQTVGKQTLAAVVHLRTAASKK